MLEKWEHSIGNGFDIKMTVKSSALQEGDICYTDRNFVDKCSQQVMHFDHEATY